jgi:hypothetical protein
LRGRVSGHVWGVIVVLTLICIIRLVVIVFVGLVDRFVEGFQRHVEYNVDK